ncbi:MAG: DUF116 domain-containing protein [Chloroflexi bacterium]|nr:DUF116 domain-containing protein [Chloroflexota bacterium]MBU1748826.1 DUF116 domain-containing protein [Chloroflexota bacterium]
MTTPPEPVCDVPSLSVAELKKLPLEEVKAMLNMSSLADLATVPADERVLLLPHCLRRSDRCQARQNREQGLLCQDCDETCAIHILRTAAQEQGYLGVCIAPGGTLAARYIKEHKPHGLVAIACDKEIDLGLQALGEMLTNGDLPLAPITIFVKLSRDGCVDTEVNVDQARAAIDA